MILRLTVDNKPLLAKALTAIIFHASAFHAVQNNAQFDYFGFVPNKPTVRMLMFFTFHAVQNNTQFDHFEFVPHKLMARMLVLSICISC